MKSKKLLSAFVAYCEAHPEERFWQALRNWVGRNFILVADRNNVNGEWEGVEDTFYWETNKDA